MSYNFIIALEVNNENCYTRSKNASVTSEGTLCGTIGSGEVLLVGFEPTDDEK